ncbi:MAG: sigma-54-dependent Fis family transcriptional regulator [Steroidobacteraceae bacterium]|nr:sigma-54-dependent Fis family transcriptional regulator [Deltaproteobacteria bacterium]
MAPIKLLIIDDELDFRESIALYFLDAGYTVFEASNGREGLDVFERERPDIVFTDLRMPVMDGFEFIAELSALNPDTPIIVISGVGLVEEVIHAMRLGARDYIVKPILDMDELKLVIMRALRESSLLKEIDSLKDKLLSGQLRHPEAFAGIITQNPPMIAAMQYLEAIAVTSQPVLITGETGTGKELLAQAVHKISGRKGPFIAVNVAGLDDQMFADALFGHVKGAFSGADQRREGLLVQAAAGTILLDEIGDLHEVSQIKLLRLLQEGEFYPLGSDTLKRTDARIVAATNRDLHGMVKEGSFRSDLYYRLFAHQIKIPPLRERNYDIALLLEYFLREAAQALGKKCPTPPPELCSYLTAYDFPGNVREMRSMVFDAVARHNKGVLSIESFRRAIGREFAVKAPVHKASQRSIILRDGDEERMPTLAEAEAVLIEQALDLAGGNQGVAASCLGISRNALNKKIIRGRA